MLCINSSHSIWVKIILVVILYLTVTGSIACFCLDESPYTKSANQAKPPDGALSMRRQSIPGKTCFAFYNTELVCEQQGDIHKSKLVIKSK